MTTNVQVENNGKENSISLIKRFTRRVQGAGILPRVRSIRYTLRKPSEYVKKKKALKVIRRKEFVKEQIKLGKMSEVVKYGRR